MVRRLWDPGDHIHSQKAGLGGEAAVGIYPEGTSSLKAIMSTEAMNRTPKRSWWQQLPSLLHSLFYRVWELVVI